LDEPQFVSGTFYVGWRQTTSDNLNLGYDKSANNQSKIFYNVSGSWQNSQYQGSLMIRPVLGSEDYPYLQITDNENKSDNLILYPNPVCKNENVYFKTDNENKLFLVKIFDVNGNLLNEFESNSQINSSNLTAGVYILQFLNLKTDNQVIKKLIITQ